MSTLFRIFIVLFTLMIMKWITASRVEASTTSNTTTAIPGCQDKCGDVSIPYPFGTSKGCGRSGFDIRCDTGYVPPRPFIGNTPVELIDVNLTVGRARVYKYVDRLCYNRTGVVENSSLAVDFTTRPVYKLSTSNAFTVIGCLTVALAQGVGARNYFSVCASVCSDLEMNNGTCTGLGCSQLAIPKGLRSFNTSFSAGVNTSEISEVSPCSYAFVVDKEWYSFSSADLVGNKFARKHERGVPVVLDWSIGNVTCEEARRNRTSYACVDRNSECFDSRNGPGYICNCSRGYQGNPYLPHGCQDINECELPAEYPCYGVCTHVPGNSSCSCPKGTSGDPKIEHGCSPNEKSSLPISLKVLIGTLSSLFFLTATSFWLYLGLEKRSLIRARRKFFEQNGGLILGQSMTTMKSNYFKIFTQEELEKATNKFDKKLIIGYGGHGTVYKGILEDKRTVAIKKSKIMEERLTEEFAKEMLLLSQINHKNVIKLLGSCLEVEVPMLVYEFISNGNLFHYLHDNNHKFSIPLDTRLRIAEESADALAYLHSYASPPIIHGDVKCSNILLDDEFAAKVSDFGASKLAPKDEVQFATVVQGTCGYLDPEYLVTCQLTVKSDVYSFGVVILELLTRKKPLEFDASGKEKSLVSVFDSAMKLGNFAEILDCEIRSDQENMGAIMEVIRLAMRCLNFSGDNRPTMKEVADSLQKLRRLGHEQVERRFDQQTASEIIDWEMERAAPTESIDASAAEIYRNEVKALLQMDMER